MTKKKHTPEEVRTERLKAVANGDFSNTLAVIEYFCVKFAQIENRLIMLEKIVSRGVANREDVSLDLTGLK